MSNIKKYNGLQKLGARILNIDLKTLPKKTNSVLPDRKTVSIPAGRVSKATNPNDSELISFDKDSTLIKPDFKFKYIEAIRHLYKYNEDVGSVIFDLIQLTNTGHKIKFDNSIDQEQVKKMRNHLLERSKEWGSGVSGISGIVNKLIAQIWVSGALSSEIVAARGLKKVENIILLNPETIRFKIKRSNGKYQPYQKINYLAGIKKQYIRLNTNTYKYYGLFSDEDIPYGVPPMITALNSIKTQKDMKDNINHIMNQMGLLGYLEVKLAKPERVGEESEEQYKARLNSLLKQAKENVIKGFKEGVVTGYEDDHEFDFHSTTKNLNGVSDIFNQNENQIANGLKTSGTFLGLKGSGTEQMLSIVFTKMLSQLKNVQIILSHFLEELYSLELLMAGFDFKTIKVEFYPSTITDDLKYQQAREIKQRIDHNLWVDGIIGQDVYADDMGYEHYDTEIERPLPEGHNTDGIEKEGREADKDKSARRSRDKKSNNPKRKDTSTKTR